MNKLVFVIASLASLATLGGCATYYPAPAYASRAYAQPDPNGWRVVSVTPVAPGTGATAGANGTAGVVTSGPAPGYAYGAAPAVVADPVYVPAPVYAAPAYDPFWYPPVSIGLGFSFGHWCCGRGYYGGHYGGHFAGRPGWRGHR